MRRRPLLATTLLSLACSCVFRSACFSTWWTFHSRRRCHRDLHVRERCVRTAQSGARERADSVGDAYELLRGPTALSQADLECVTQRQLLLPPGSDWEQEAPRLRAGHRCRHGFPQVLVMDPLRASGKIGDLMRVTCPLLVAAIDEFETTAIEAYNARVRRDESWRSQLLATNEAHRTIRERFMLEHHAKLSQAKMTMGNSTVDMIMTTGLANMRFTANSSDVKCLHAQVADELARGNNTIGRQVLMDLAESGVEVEGNDYCCDFCNISQPLEQSRWAFDHAKNKLRGRLNRHKCSR